MTTVSSAAPALVCGAPHPHLIGLIEEFCGDAEMAARIAAGLAAVLGDGRAEPTILEVTRLFFAGLDDVVKDARDHPSSQMLQAWLRDEARMDDRQVGRVLAHLAAARDAGRLPAEARLLPCLGLRMRQNRRRRRDPLSRCALHPAAPGRHGADRMAGGQVRRNRVF